MSEVAVVDRFEGSKALLLLGSKGQPMVVERRQLPPGTKEGDHLRVEVRAGNLIKAESDRAATERAKERIKGKLSRLRKGDHLR